jgi:hypothetical protein
VFAHGALLQRAAAACRPGLTTMVLVALANDDDARPREPAITHHRYDMSHAGRLGAEQRRELLHWLSGLVGYPTANWQPPRLHPRPRMLGARATYHTVDWAWRPGDAAFKHKPRVDAEGRPRGWVEGNFPKNEGEQLMVEQRLQPEHELEARALLQACADATLVVRVLRAAVADPEASYVAAGQSARAAAAYAAASRWAAAAPGGLASALDAVGTMASAEASADSDSLLDNWRRLEAAGVWKRLRLTPPSASELGQLARALPYRAERLL